MSVRELRPEQAEALRGPLRDLAYRAKASWGYDQHFLEAFALTLPTSLLQPGRRTLLAEDDGVVTGFAVVDDRGDGAWLEDLWVEPTHQRRGVGRRLFEAATATAARLGRTRLEWESDPHAEPFYVALGARRIALIPSTLAGERLIPVMRVDLDGAYVARSRRS